MTDIFRYSPPLLHRNAHFATIIPNLFRNIQGVNYSRHTIETPDDDFVDVDVSSVQSDAAILLLHGLEGSSASTYMLGMSRAANMSGMDALAMNHRGCSGRPNNQLASYHSGKSDDVLTVINAFQNRYKRMYIIGFSLGGNIALKLAGESNQILPDVLKGLVAVSVPCDLSGSGSVLGSLKNSLYLLRFLKDLKRKAIEKCDMFPRGDLNTTLIRKSKTFIEFDDAFTAPANGFDSALDYYKKCSSKQFIKSIKLPTLIINAKNDSFLPDSCYPFEEVASNPHVSMLNPDYGGHVGFAQNHRLTKSFWHEDVSMKFIASLEK